MKAAQKAAEHAREQSASKTEAGENAPASSPAAPSSAQAPAIGTRIGRTVMPSRTEIVCHSCAHTFEITGKSSQTVCPKCRTRLKLEEVSIEGEWSRDLLTSGTIEVKEGGEIQGGVIVANNLVVRGKVLGGEIRVTRRLEIHAGAEVDLTVVAFRDLLLGEGVEMELAADRAALHHVHLHGHLHAHLDLTGCLHIVSGGCLSGSITGPRLILEEGGGLLAAVNVGNPDSG